MNTTIPILSESGSYLICALLVQANLTDCTTFDYILPPAQVSIIYPVNNSVIDEPTYHWYYNTDYVSIQSSISNYTGYLTWTVLSSDDVDNNGTISSSTWTTYHSQYASIAQTNQHVGYGNKTICVELSSLATNNTQNQTNPYQISSDCVDVEIIPRRASVDVWVDSQQNSNFSNGIYLLYEANNYSSGKIKLNNVTRNHLGAYFEYIDHNQTNESSNDTHENYTSYYIQGYYLNYGNNTICLEIDREDGYILEDCIVYYIPHPVIRIQIIYDNTTIHSQGHIRLGYFTENYTGYLDWDFSLQLVKTIRKARI